jgi:hypothetical protein
MESVIHKGLIVQMAEAGYAYVWIPTANSIVPLGFSEYLYENTGGQLYGTNLSDSIGTSYKCKIATSLTGGAWFHPNHTKGASVFDDYDHNAAYDYRVFPDYQTHANSGVGNNYVLPTDMPTASGCVSVSTLSVIGGNQIPNLGTMPKGQFPMLEENQWVLVAFINSSTNPVIFARIPSDEEWNVIKY